MIVELHAIQSFAPANLNRDDTGAPKECTFGGVRRARVSSQSWKRAIRMRFRDDAETVRFGTRTKRAHQEIVDRLQRMEGDLDADKARHRAAVVLEAEPLGLSLKRSDEVGEIKTGQLLFFRDADFDALAEVARDHADELDEAPSSLLSEKSSAKVKLSAPARKRIEKAMTSSGEALDVALFGRMIAEMPEGNVDAACQVAHAVGTHRLAAEFDYYTAVDDLKPEDTEGADMIGTVQFNASCLYRYAALDIDQLARNLDSAGDAQTTIGSARTFARAFIEAIPTGKQNTFAARNAPFAVLAVQREAGAWNLANAFLDPVDTRQTNGGLAVESARRLLEEFSSLNGMYGREQDRIAAALLAGADLAPDGVAQVRHVDELIAWIGNGR